MRLPAILKKNSFVLGMLMGIWLPAVFYLFLWLLDQVFFQTLGQHLTRAHHLLYLLATIVNLLPVRYYLVKLKFEKTGLGTLAVTAILIFVYFYLFFSQ